MYTNDLVARQITFLNLRPPNKSPYPKQDRDGGNWLFTAGTDGTPADPEQVMTLYRFLKTTTRYKGSFLTLRELTRYWLDWVADAAAVRERFAIEQRKADYARGAANGHGPKRTTDRQQSYTKTGEDMAPKGWN